LRDALVTSEYAEVRAAALHRLDGEAARRLLPHVQDATHDPSMLVREASFVALARAADTASLGRAEYACRHDRGFRVRRMALVFAARTFGTDSLRLVALASRDPFWRVRVAARRVAAALDASVDVTAHRADDHPVDLAIPGIADPDPAVVTARLQRLRDRVDPLELVPALAHSHQALRRCAVLEVAARGNAAALHAATRWLVDERVPYAPSAAEATLARSGARAVPVAAELIERFEDEPAGPLSWALCVVTPAPPWLTLAKLLTHDDPRVRRAAVLRVPEAAPGRDALVDAMARLLLDDDDVTRGRASAWLSRTGSADARARLLSLEPPTQPTFVRSSLLDVHCAARNVAGIRLFVDDEHTGIRTAALSALAHMGELSPGERLGLAGDPDPWVRRAVLNGIDAEERLSWAASAANDPDAALRAQAASALASVVTDPSTVKLLRLARDHDPGVRSIAIAALERQLDAVRRVLDSGRLEPDERIAAYSLLRLHGALGHSTEEHPAAAAHLELLDDVLHERAPLVSTTPRHRFVQAPTSDVRTLGSTGIRVHPFGLSGAHGLAFEDFARAHERGVNLYFWEPTHRELARFLRARPEAVVVSGTYHADADSIERDVERALRVLKRESLDVFLAFWTRSMARLEATRDILASLVRRGWVRAFGVSTHDRELAVRAAEDAFDVVMVRHSAAHRGAEATVLPRCAGLGKGVLTFSNLCYGRMLHRTPAAMSSPVTAPDCYRYSLSQPGVDACIAAPRRTSELLENLVVADVPTLSPARAAELREHGKHVYERSKAWSAETWSVSERPRPEATADNPERLDDWIDVPESMSQDLW
jgi:aryl-alcohol dehydrogenase-like predicted oxidoreductase